MPNDGAPLPISVADQEAPLLEDAVGRVGEVTGTLTGHVLFVLVLLAHQRRRIVHFTVTEHPTAAWTAQQVIEAFPNHTAPKWLLRDRDAIFGEVFRRRVAGMGITEVISTPSSPWQNPYVGGTSALYAASVSIT